MYDKLPTVFYSVQLDKPVSNEVVVVGWFSQWSHFVVCDQFLIMYRDFFAFISHA